MSRHCKLRSPLEDTLASQLKRAGVSFSYEGIEIPYTEQHTYVPDFILPNGIMIEAKGWLRPENRRKHVALKKQHPELDIRFVFQNAHNKLNKNSKTTYAEWADRHGIKWAEKYIPEEWIKEKKKE